MTINEAVKVLNENTIHGFQLHRGRVVTCRHRDEYLAMSTLEAMDWADRTIDGANLNPIDIRAVAGKTRAEAVKNYTAHTDMREILGS